MKGIKIKIFIFLFCFYYSKEFIYNDYKLDKIFYNNFKNNSLFQSFLSKSKKNGSDLEIDNLKKLLVNFIDFIIYTSANDPDIHLSDNCKITYLNAFDYIKNESAYFQILYDKSSKSKNDLGSYQDCLNYIDEDSDSDEIIKKDDLTYLIIHIKENNVKEFGAPENEEGEYLIGLCVPNACKENEYEQIFEKVNAKITIFNKADYTKVYDLYNEPKIGIKLLSTLPIIFILFFCMFSCFKQLPYFFFKRLVNSKDIDCTYKLEQCFDLTENIDELIFNSNSNEKNTITNESGLIALNGIKGVTMILVIITSTFYQIYCLPAKIYNTQKFKFLIMNYSFALVYYGGRFGIRLLFSISGYILSFKFINYLDSKIELKDEEMRISNKNIDGLKQDSDKKFDDNDDDDDENYIDPIELEIKKNESFNLEKKKDNNDINNKKDKDNLDNKSKKIVDEKQLEKYSYRISDFTLYTKYNLKLDNIIVIKFMLRYAYRYIFFILVIFFFKFSMINPLYLIYEKSPIWLYCKEEIEDKFDYLKFISTMLLFTSFSNKTFLYLNPFNIVTNEIFFFIFGTIFIFFSYKHNLRIDLYIFLIILIIEILKLFIFLIFYKEESGIFPLMFYQDIKKRFILFNPIYNLPCFLIGILFGMVNYCIQNSLKAKETEKTFLIIPKFISKFLNKKNKCFQIFIIFISMVISIVIILDFSISINRYSKEDLRKFFINKLLNIIFLYDIDIALFFMFIGFQATFVYGDNPIINFFRHEYWGIVSRPYFTFIVIMDVISCYIFYQSENRIKLELFNIIFFGLEICLVVLFFQMVFYIFLEIPFKKLNKILVEGNIRKKNN